MGFYDRTEAGRLLAKELLHYRERDDVVVLALPRGGVPVACEVAKALHASLDVFLVRKLGLPGHEELAMGAIASGGVMVLNPDVVESLDIPDRIIQAVAAKERNELERREHEYRDGRPPVEIVDHVVIVIDDGLATGATMHAAVEAIRQQRPKHLVVAVPVGAASTCDELRQRVDEVVCSATPEHFLAVGAWYEDFAQTSDEDVKALLAESRQWAGQPAPLSK
jgi:putative phosphoribosyl transferase